MFDMSPGMLISGLLLSSIGLFFFMHSKRMSDPVGIVGGILLMMLPLFMHSLAILWLVSVGVIGAVLAYRRLGGVTG
jgi:hypothetical protein